MRKWLVGGCTVATGLVALAFALIHGGAQAPAGFLGGRMVDFPGLSPYPATPRPGGIDLLFIHHSCGGQWLATTGPETGSQCIHPTHPNGGGLRRALERHGYRVHEASYGSLIGEETDICHWNRKFRDQMDRILSCRMQDERLPDGETNRVVMFKPCFPNNWIVADGSGPGNPDASERTLANCMAAYRALLPSFQAHPDVLFVAVTAPPLARPPWNLREGVKSLLGRDDTAEKVGLRALRFNQWLADPAQGWLKGYPLRNVVVFDLFGALRGSGDDPWSGCPTGRGEDSHPSALGNAWATELMVPFLNRALNRLMEGTETARVGGEACVR